MEIPRSTQLLYLYYDVAATILSSLGEEAEIL
jgi:hypothetical protein